MSENGFNNKEGVLDCIRPEKYPSKTYDGKNPDFGVFILFTICYN